MGSFQLAIISHYELLFLAGNNKFQIIENNKFQNENNTFLIGNNEFKILD